MSLRGSLGAAKAAVIEVVASLAAKAAVIVVASQVRASAVYRGHRNNWAAITRCLRWLWL